MGGILKRSHGGTESTEDTKGIKIYILRDLQAARRTAVPRAFVRIFFVSVI
jgi:hypothetical protein